MAKLGDLVVHIGANTTALNASLGKVQRNMRSMTGNFTKLGMSMSKAITLPLALIGGLALRTSVKFEASMAKVKAVSGATAKEFDSLAASAKELGRTTVFTASEVAGLQLEFAKLGFTAVQINEVTEATLNLAQATGSDLAQAAEVAGATLGGFGLAASETGRVADVMAASFSASALDINHFQESMKLVAPNAKAAGVSLEETTAMLAVLSKAGIKGSSAGTALRRILQEMQGTSGTLTERFAELNKSGLDVQGSMDEVGRRAGTSLLVLAEGSGEVQSLTDSFGHSSGAAKAMADVMNDTTAGALKRMTSALEGAGIIIGDALAPGLSSVATFVNDLATDFSNLSKTTQKNILMFAGVSAVLGPMLIIIPKIIAGIKATRIAWIALNASLLVNPIYLVTAAIVALGVVMVATSGDIHNSRKETDKYIQSLKGLDKQASINAINAKIREEKDKLTAANKKLATSELLVARASDKFDRKIATDSVNRYKSIVEGLTDSLGLLEQELESIDAKGGIGGAVEGAIEGVDEGGAVKSVGEALVQTVSKVQLKMHELAGMGTTAMITLSNGVQDFAVNSSTSLLAFLDDFTNVAEEIESVNEGVKDSFTTLADTINAEIERGAEAMIGGLALMVGAAIGAEKPIEGMGAFMGEVLAQMAINIGQYAIAHGTVIEAIKASLIDLGGVGAIVAGAALIALGAGMKSAIQKNAEAAGVPALAEGGLMYGPSLIVAGDNKNANIDPEVVAPLSKLKDMLGGNSIQVYGRISGDDIVISNNRASRDRNRF